MQSDYSEKITYKFTPCKPPESCLDYDDYDPCEASDDITEKDLAVLLKEEKLKLQTEREKEQQHDTIESIKTEEKVAQNAFIETTKTENAALQDKLGKYRKEQDKDSPKAADNLTDGTEEDETPVKKRVCKKFIKNPFFSNRLKFSSDLPPPPPSPPEQFLPTVEETASKDRIVCQKRKKKCKKVDDLKKARKDERESDGSEADGKTSSKEDDGGWKEDGKYSTNGWADKKDDLFQTGERNSRIDDESRNDGESRLHDDKSGLGSDKSAEDLDKSEKTDANGAQFGTDEYIDEKKKKRCTKSSNRPPCRKKEEEISITLQPRQIPAAQKDLPETCPKDIINIRNTRLPCKKICKKKGNDK